MYNQYPEPLKNWKRKSLIAASMGRGELSYSKVRALTRVACEATEDTFLMIALHGTAHHVERLVSGYRPRPARC